MQNVFQTAFGRTKLNLYLRPILIIWYRELLRYWRNRVRSVSSLMMPFLWLVLFGSGISGSLKFASREGLENFNYVKFLFPGVLGITVLFTSMFNAITLVRDKEFGFFKAIMVAPVPRVSIAIGRILGGATVATFQGLFMTILLPLVGLPLTFKLFTLVPFIFLFALMMNSLGLIISANIKTTEGFQMVMQLLTFPMFMLSGALFPLRNIPAWLEFLSKINPASYAIDMLRKVTFSIFDIPTSITDNFSLSLFGATLNLFGDVDILLLLTLIMVVVATYLFSTQES